MAITSGFTLVALSIALACALPMSAHAQSLGAALCASISNNMGVLSAIASLGVIVLGIAATLGKVTWKQAILVMLGIAVVSGAASIVLTIASSVDVTGDGQVNITDLAVLGANWCSAR